ncbi:MAG: PEP-CTERM sorting domain-containing protein [Cyanobacteria bacterium J06642_2]
MLSTIARVVLAVTSGLALAASVNGVARAASLTNGGFETGDFTGWNTLGNASIQTAAFGSGPVEGTSQALVSSGGSTVTDAAIETALGLSAGTLDGISTGDANSGSVVYQTFTADAGETLSFDYNFLTNETTPTTFNDFAFISLTSTSLLEDTNSGFVSSPTSFSEETGFSAFSTKFSSSGTFTLAVGVLDVNDGIVDTAILVDNVNVVPEPASTAGLAIAGLAGVASYLRRRQKQAVAS